MRRLALILALLPLALATAPAVLAALGAGETTMDSAEFSYPDGQNGWDTFGVYPSACRLMASTRRITFTVPSGYTFTVKSAGQGRAIVNVDGTDQSPAADGGGSVFYEAGPYPAGSVVLTVYDGGSTHSNGGGGASYCGRSVTLSAIASPSPSASPTPTPTPTPAPSVSPDPMCDPYCAVALVSADRDRIDLLTFAVGMGFALMGGLTTALVLAQVRR